jgi:Asp-tRNA(Asn)/Glu-tRNA(Gln) amidotransferase A subunit family amidase
VARADRKASKPARGLEHVLITYLGPVSSRLRLAVKDLFDTAGVRTTYGAEIFHDHVPESSALAV